MIEFKLPALGENIEQGDLVRLMIAPGAAVKEGQAVMELETDKAVVEVPSSVSGTVKEIRVKEGDKIKVGQVIFTADSNGSAASADSARQAAPPKTAPVVAPEAKDSVPSPSPKTAAESKTPPSQPAPRWCAWARPSSAPGERETTSL